MPGRSLLAHQKVISQSLLCVCVFLSFAFVSPPSPFGRLLLTGCGGRGSELIGSDAMPGALEACSRDLLEPIRPPDGTATATLGQLSREAAGGGRLVAGRK